MTKGISYKLKDRVITRRILLNGGDVRTSSIHVPCWLDRSQDFEAIYDLAWLASTVRPALRAARGELRAIDLFCGCGGLTLGVREAARALGYKFNPVFASDINANALALYKKNFNPNNADMNPIEVHLNGELGAEVTTKEAAFLGKVGKIGSSQLFVRAA